MVKGHTTLQKARGVAEPMSEMAQAGGREEASRDAQGKDGGRGRRENEDLRELRFEVQVCALGVGLLKP